MKKTIFKLMIASCVATAGYYQYSQQENNINDVVFQNIEALAGDEHYVDIFCYGNGSVECEGIKVEMKIEGLRLD